MATPRECRAAGVCQVCREQAQTHRSHRPRPQPRVRGKKAGDRDPEKHNALRVQGTEGGVMVEASGTVVFPRPGSCCPALHGSVTVTTTGQHRHVPRLPCSARVGNKLLSARRWLQPQARHGHCPGSGGFSAQRPARLPAESLSADESQVPSGSRGHPRVTRFSPRRAPGKFLVREARLRAVLVGAWPGTGWGSPGRLLSQGGRGRPSAPASCPRFRRRWGASLLPGPAAPREPSFPCISVVRPGWPRGPEGPPVGTRAGPRETLGGQLSSPFGGLAAFLSVAGGACGAPTPSPLPPALAGRGS